jgi:hypothetical protein
MSDGQLLDRHAGQAIADLRKLAAFPASTAAVKTKIRPGNEKRHVFPSDFVTGVFSSTQPD